MDRQCVEIYRNLYTELDDGQTVRRNIIEIDTELDDGQTMRTIAELFSFVSSGIVRGIVSAFVVCPSP